MVYAETETLSGAADRSSTAPSYRKIEMIAMR